MPLDDFIGESLLRGIMEAVVYGVTYATGHVILTLGSFGQLRLAPMSTLFEKNRDKRRWYQIDWSIWLRQPGRGGC
jgi:hypothetical protein